MYKAIKRSFKKRIRRQEEWMDLQKGQRTMRKVYAVIALVILSGVGTDAYTRAYPSRIEIDNPRHWDAGKAAESVQPQEAQQKDEAKDGVVVEGDIERLIQKFFPEETKEAIAIFKSESGLNPSKESDSDRMADGRPFSAGIAQINLTVSNLDGVPCNQAFSGRNYKAKVIDEKLYQRCLKLAKTPEIALATARKKYDGNGFNHWTVYLNGSYKKHL